MNFFVCGSYMAEFVLFYSPRCRHCIKLLDSIGPISAQFQTVDIHSEHNFSMDGVHSVPTIRSTSNSQLYVGRAAYAQVENVISNGMLDPFESFGSFSNIDGSKCNHNGVLDRIQSVTQGSQQHVQSEAASDKASAQVSEYEALLEQRKLDIPSMPQRV